MMATSESLVAETKWLDLYTALIIPAEAVPQGAHGVPLGLEALVTGIFSSSGMLHNVEKSSITNLRNVVSSARRQYNDNKYHCFLHASHVLVNCAKILDDIVRHQPSFPRVEGLALLFAALIHDVGHLGVSNATLSRESHRLAILYSDQSVAEMNSLACAFQMLELPEHDILGGYSQDERITFRGIVIDLVLSTNVCDKERQQQLRNKFESASRCKLNGDRVDLAIPSNRLAVFNLIIRAADVGAQMQNEKTAGIWSYRFFLEQQEAREAGRAPQSDTEAFCLEQGKFMERHAAVLAAALQSTGNLSASLSCDILESTHRNLAVWGVEGPAIVETWCTKSQAGPCRGGQGGIGSQGGNRQQGVAPFLPPWGPKSPKRPKCPKGPA